MEEQSRDESSDGWIPQANDDSIASLFAHSRRRNAAFIAAIGSAVQQPVMLPHSRILLDNARQLIEHGHFSMAIVASHIACELATELVLSSSFSKKKIKYLQDAVINLLNGHNLANDKIRKLYTALTGDAIQKQPFWRKFKESAKHRNDIVHHGKTLGRAEAEDSFKTANDLINYLEEIERHL